jgi:hypothetical protein
MVVAYITRELGDGLKVAAVQSWDEVDEHVDMVYRIEPDPRGDAGVRESSGDAPPMLIGASSVYLAPDFVSACPEQILNVIAVGTGGRVGASEISYAASSSLADRSVAPSSMAVAGGALRVTRIRAPDARCMD